MREYLAVVHRRGIWQVLVIFLGGAALALWAVRLLTTAVGLPPWTPMMALVLLLIALPFTLAAAFVRGETDSSNPLRGLVAELHRRSLWQVMGIFLAGSWGALQVVDVITETAGLPDWTPPMALALLLVGLPVCLATAFVQEGMPGGGSERPEAAARTESRPEVRGARGLLTWVNALLGGVGAFALLGLAAGAYLVMWSAGIGPVGNLLAQGAIDRGARVVLADFRDGTGEGLGDAITTALRADLQAASVLELVERPEVASTLDLMRLAPGTRLSTEIARDVAQRVGAAAIIEGEVAIAGSGYIVTAALSESDSGRSLASFRATAGGADEVIGAIDALSQDIREKSGESLRTIRAGPALADVTTSSLEALKLYTEGVAVHESGDLRGSAEVLGQAVTVDSTFAMAWRLLGIAAASDPTREAEAYTKAFRYRDRLQSVERYLVEAIYYTSITGDNQRAMAAYRNALREDPTNVSALNNLAEGHRRVGEWEEALTLYERGAPFHAVPYGNLVRTLTWLGRFDEADSALGGFAEAHPGHPRIERLSFALSLAKGDLVGALRFAGPHAVDPSEVTNSEHAFRQAQVAVWSGRLDEARALYLRREALDAAVPVDAWEARVETAYEEGLVAEAEWARSHISQGLEGEFLTLPPIDRDHEWTALQLARSGDTRGAEFVIQDWKDAAPQVRKGPGPSRTMERAALYARAARGDTVGAVEAIDRLLLASGCTDACWLFGRARIYDWSGASEEAIELYERVLGSGYDLGMTDGVNVGERLHAMIRLGPLYESVGDTARAIAAYQRLVDQWRNADERGMETVQIARARIGALGS